MKKTNIFWVLLPLLSGFGSECFAQDSEWSINLKTMSMDYTEYYDNGSKADSESADSIPGIGIGYKTFIGNGLDGGGGYFDAELSLYSGDTTYTGSYIGGTYGDVVATTNNRYTDMNAGYGENRVFDDGLWFVRVGMGYRIWERGLADGHDEVYYWPYGSIKTGITTNLGIDDLITLEAQYHRAFFPKMHSNILGTFDLGTTSGYSIGIPWTHRLNSEWSVNLGYMYQTWDIEKSNVVDGWYEPRSESYSHQVTFGLVYRY